MPTQKEKEVIPQVIRLIRDVKQGSVGAIGAKECLRNQIESERLALHQLVSELEKGSFKVTYPEWDFMREKMALSVYVLDATKPDDIPWHQKGLQGAGEPLRNLRKLEGRAPLRSKRELNIYLYWTVTHAIIFTGAAPFLDTWFRAEAKQQQLIKKLKKEAISNRKKAKARR